MEPFKNNISPELVGCIAFHLQKHLPGFDGQSFEAGILVALESLELKQRARLIADHMHRVLPSDAKTRYQILLAMLHPLEEGGSSGQSNEKGICGWGMLPLGMVVGHYGLSHFEESLIALKEMTKRFSSEFDVRPFLLADQERALTHMAQWVSDPDRHVRRLVSEGTRPRLPWAMQLPKLIADPTPVLPLLTALRDDEEAYVRRSVANHLNDISKDHPDLIARLAATWLQGGGESREKLMRHACRSLIKQGHRGTLDAFGLGDPKIKLIELSLQNEQVVFGGALAFRVELESISTSPQALVMDYVMHFKKANGKRVGKVFKWKKFSLGAGEVISLSRSHPIRPITTRRYYSGIQALSLRINGRDFGLVEFHLEMKNQT